MALFLAITCVPTRAQSAGPQLTLHSGIKFKGDLFDGLATGRKLTPTGAPYVGLIQSNANASPLPKEVAAVVNGLIEAFLTHHPERYGSYVLAGPVMYIHDVGTQPRDFASNGFPFEFKGKLTANTPYYLKEKERSVASYNVRVEWLVDGQLAFLTWLSVFHGKVIGIIADDAKPPPLPRSAFDPPDASSTLSHP
jgi:hypothetical protein